MLDLKHIDHAISELLKEAEQFDDLRLEKEVVSLAFLSRTVLSADFELAYDLRPGVEDGLSIANLETFEPAEVNVLH